MMSIIDYIRKYGQFDYDELPFNNVDALILSQFSYFKFDGLLPEVGQNLPNVTVSQLSKMPDAQMMFADKRWEKNNRALFEAMSNNRRFSFLRLNHYINIIDDEWDIQFSAITIFLPDNSAHVVFRGTDETFTGWKEDLNMSFMTPIPAQEKALDYVNYVASLLEGDFTIGGHSKGGNLAVYAAMMCSSDIRSRIAKIYNQDGPGFTAKTLAASAYADIKGKIIKLVPHSSIVGMLLDSHEEYEIVACKNFGILQHDPFNWLVEGTDFIYRNELTKHIALQNASVNEWADALSDEELKSFTDAVFDVFERSGVSDLVEYYKNPVESTKKILQAASQMSQDRQEMLKAVMAVLLECVLEQIKDQVKDQFKEPLMEIDQMKEQIRDLLKPISHK